jgi:hypothetical protein
MAASSDKTVNEAKIELFPDQYLSLGKDLYVIVGVFNGWPSISVRICGFNEKLKVPYPKSDGNFF